VAVNEGWITGIVGNAGSNGKRKADLAGIFR